MITMKFQYDDNKIARFDFCQQCSKNYSPGVILDKTAAADVTNMTSLYYWHLYYPKVQDIGLKWVVLNSSSPRQASKTGRFYIKLDRFVSAYNIFGFFW